MISPATFAARFPDLRNAVVPSGPGATPTPLQLPSTGQINQIVLTSYQHGVPFSSPGAEYALYVPNIDRNGNAIAGIRVPEVSVPLASYEGWNLRAAGHAIGEGCISTGSAIPLATNRQQEAAGTDTRARLADLYTGRADYQAKVAASATALVRAGYLLPEDAQADFVAPAANVSPNLIPNP